MYSIALIDTACLRGTEAKLAARIKNLEDRKALNILSFVSTN